VSVTEVFSATVIPFERPTSPFSAEIDTAPAESLTSYAEFIPGLVAGVITRLAASTEVPLVVETLTEPLSSFMDLNRYVALDCGPSKASDPRLVMWAVELPPVTTFSPPKTADGALTSKPLMVTVPLAASIPPPRATVSAGSPGAASKTTNIPLKISRNLWNTMIIPQSRQLILSRQAGMMQALAKISVFDFTTFAPPPEPRVMARP
jgi:hypothetical protein